MKTMNPVINLGGRRPFVVGYRSPQGWVEQDSVRVYRRPLRNEGDYGNPWFSSCGFEWGYGGQGPRCLAFSLTVRYYQRRRYGWRRWLLAHEAWGAVFNLIKAQPNNGPLVLDLLDIRRALADAGHVH